MSEHLPDSPIMTTPFCPGCEPERDPLRELLVEARCEFHRQPLAGADDAAVVGGYLSGTAEAGDETNRDFCALIHGGRR